MLRFLWVSLVVVLADQASKLWILDNFYEYQVVQIWPVFNLTLVYNTGAAFSFLADAGGWQRYLFSSLAAVVSVVLLVWLKGMQAHERLVAWAVALVLGGAIGNLIDRLVYGKVVDFIQWHWEQYYFPSFNLADSAITLGVVLLLVDTFLPADRAQKKL